MSNQSCIKKEKGPFSDFVELQSDSIPSWI
jgi:hypothetical protein